MDLEAKPPKSGIGNLCKRRKTKPTNHCFDQKAKSLNIFSCFPSFGLSQIFFGANLSLKSHSSQFLIERKHLKLLPKVWAHVLGKLVSFKFQLRNWIFEVSELNLWKFCVDRISRRPLWCKGTEVSIHGNQQTSFDHRGFRSAWHTD